MNLARALARVTLALRRPARRVPWLRLVRFEAAPKPIGPASDWTPPSPDNLFDEKWTDFPMLKASSAAWMKRKVYAKADFEKLTDAVKARSFTAARVASNKGLYDTLVSLQHGVSDGLTIREWREKYWDNIQKKYGKPGGTAPWYTLTVFRTNQQAAHAAGRYAEMFDEESIALQPYVRYSAILDARVRPEHAALNGKVFLKTDPNARQYFPPLGFNCRCNLEALPPGVTPRKITNGASIPGLPTPGGGTVGLPPKGWAVDRVDALLESFNLTKAAKLAKAGPVVPPPPPPPPKPVFGDPDWEAPNGLTQAKVDEAYGWNPAISKAKLLESGGLEVTYKSIPTWPTVIAPEKAPNSIKLQLSKKAKPPAPPKPKAAPAPLQTTPAGYTQTDLEQIKAAIPGWTKLYLQPDGSVIYESPGKGMFGIAKGNDVDMLIAAWKTAAKLPEAPAVPVPVKAKPTLAVKKTPGGHDVTPGNIEKVWGKSGVISQQGLLVDYDYEILPDGSLKLTKPPTSTKAFLDGTFEKTLPPGKVAEILDKQLGKAPAPPPTLKTLSGFSQADLDEINAAIPNTTAAWKKAILQLDGRIDLYDGSGNFLMSVKPGFAADNFVEAWKQTLNLSPHPVGAKPIPIAGKAKPAPLALTTKKGLTQADIDDIGASYYAPGTKVTLGPDGALAIVPTKGSPLFIAPEKVDDFLDVLKTAGSLAPPTPAPVAPATVAPAKVVPKAAAPPAAPAKDPLYNLKPIDVHHSVADMKKYDATWDDGGGKKSFGAVVFDEQGRILLREPANHYDNYVWTFAKGKIDASESPLQCAIREVREETGVTFEAVGTIKGSHKGGSGQNNYFLGRATKSTGVLDAETSRIRWVGWDEAEDLIKQTTNATGRARDLEVLKRARAEYKALTGKEPPTFPKIVKPPPPPPAAPTFAPVAAPPPVVVRKPIPGGPAKLPVFDGFPDDPGELRYVRDLGGSTGAKLMEDKQGRRFVMKTGASPDHIREECWADAAYHAAGVNVPEFRLYEVKGKAPVKLSKYIESESLADVVAKGGKRADEVLERLRKDLALDALFGNWDVVGSGMDNVRVDALGVPWRVDNGGSLRFRAKGATKVGSEWNDWPTELWTLRGIGQAETDATRLFKSAGWKSIVGRTDEAVKAREAILRALPPEVRKTVAARLEVMETLAADSKTLFADDFVEAYADLFSRHRVGMGQGHVFDQLPTKLDGKSRVTDEFGREWGGLRSRDGAMKHFTDYLNGMGKDHADIITGYLSEQAGSSQNSAPHVFKGWLMTKRPAPKGFYRGKLVDDSSFLDSFRAEMKRKGATWAAHYNEAMAAQHAFTFELLGRVKTHDNDPVARVMRLGRNRTIHEPIKVGQSGVFYENPAESTFWAQKEFSPGSGYIEWLVPHHRIFVSYWQCRPGRWGSPGLYYLKEENEFIAMLAGLTGKRKR